MLTIGEFSKISHISSRMLRHYDKIGLLSPVYTGSENGYRYYDISQIQILHRIEKLKKYGFTLSEIKELMTLKEEAAANKIHSRRIKAYEELNEMRKAIRHMEDDLMKMEESDLMQDKYNVILMEIPAQKVFGIRKRINVGETHDLFMQLKNEMNKRGISRCGATQLIYYGKEFSYEDMDVEAQVQVSGENSEIKEITAQLCAVTTHIGPYEEIHYAYDSIGTWMANHPEYKIAGPAIERYIKDEGTVKFKEELETGILFPVKKLN